MSRSNRDKNSNYDTQAVSIRRVDKVTAGGKRLRFSALVVAGNKKGRVGVELGRGDDTRSAIIKASKRAEKKAEKIDLIGDTIPHEVTAKVGAAKVLLKPAKPGTGVIAGSSVRPVLELAGIKNVYGKVLGSSDLIANAYCTLKALKKLRSDRVLKKMKKMRERVEYAAKLEEESKKRDALRAEIENKQDNNSRKDKRGNRGKGKGRGNNKSKK